MAQRAENPTFIKRHPRASGGIVALLLMVGGCSALTLKTILENGGDPFVNDSSPTQEPIFPGTGIPMPPTEEEDEAEPGCETVDPGDTVGTIFQSEGGILSPNTFIRIKLIGDGHDGSEQLHRAASWEEINEIKTTLFNDDEVCIETHLNVELQP